MQLPTGGIAFYPGSDEDSPYFSGETWLALAHYDRLFPGDPMVAEMLAAAEDYFIRTYLRAFDGAFFHWGMMAAAVRFETTAEQRYLDFVSLQGWQFVVEVRPDFVPESNECYSVEGLAAGARAMWTGGRGSDPGYGAMVDRAERELVKIFALQIMPGQTRIDVGEGRFFYDPGLERMVGAFRNGQRLMRSRIDFTQHCLSAIVHYGELRDTLATAE